MLNSVMFIIFGNFLLKRQFVFTLRFSLGLVTLQLYSICIKYMIVSFSFRSPRKVFVQIYLVVFNSYYIHSPSKSILKPQKYY